MINTLINDLKIFAQDNFHVETVSSYLKDLNLSEKDLKNMITETKLPIQEI